MTFGKNQSGKIQLGCAFGVLVMALGIWIGIQTVPVFAKISEFDKAIGHHAERINLPRNSEKTVREAILAQAQDLELPVSKKDINIKKSKSRINVRIAYTVEIDYGFYVWEKRQEHDVERVIF